MIRLKSSRRLVTTLAVLATALASFGAVSPSQAASITVVTAPKINNYAKAGMKVSATLAKFSTKPTSVSQQWLLGGKPIAKATALAYTIPKATTTGNLVFRETAKFGSKTQTVLSNVIAIGKLFVSAPPGLAYTDGSDTALAVTLPTVQPAPVSTTIDWLRNGFPLLSDNAATRTLTLSDHGNRISARLTYKAPAGYTDLVVTTEEQTIDSVARTYVQGWSDEFDGTAGSFANTAYWGAENGDGVAAGNRGWGNNELEWYRWENATQNGNGSLDILATRDGASATKCYYGDCQWYSSKISTKGKIGFTYGRLEARIKGAGGAGTWNAFWTLGANIDTAFWPMCGEIDVTELVGSRPNDVLGYSHGPLSQGWGRGSTTQTSVPWANDYHVYAVDWLPDQIIWYIDGVKYAAVDRTDADWRFNQEFYVILNLAMGGNLGGTPDANLQSSTMSVDYVRWSTINGIGTKTIH